MQKTVNTHRLFFILYHFLSIFVYKCCQIVVKMPTTFKALVYSDNKRQDGTYNVKIRVTHNRRTLKVSTNLYATVDDLTRSLKLKNQEYIDQTDDMIRRWRGIVAKLGIAADTMDVKQIVEHIEYIEKNGDNFRLDFIEYGRTIAASKSKGTRATYDTALNALSRFVKGRPIDISKVTAKFLSEFEKFIENEPVHRGDRKNGVVQLEKSKAGGRAVSLYLASLRHIHNKAKEEFNDEDNGLINIPLSPFKKYKVKKPPKAKKRAVSSNTVQAFINLPDMERIGGGTTDMTRQDLARDCFLLSFGLGGMNAADLYDDDARMFTDKNESIIVYKRKKTRTRREDEAEMYIRVEPCIMPLIEKYRDPTNERLFCFYKHYSTIDGFNDALRKGLKIIELKIKSKKHIVFYSARHSWATIGRSKELNIDKYTIHEGLNHVDADMKATDIYIDRDYSTIWEANAEILAMFDWSAMLNREKIKKDASRTTRAMK